MEKPPSPPWLGKWLAKAGYQVAVCGNIGQPVLALLEGPQPDFYVLELSSFQLETTHHLRAKVATVLNISPDHMDRYQTLADYIDAKKRIYAESESVVMNLDDAASWPDRAFAKSIGFTLTEPTTMQFGISTHQNEAYLCFGDQPLVPCSALRLQGTHHYQNALSALALGYAAGLPFEPMIAALKAFDGIRHRCQWLRTVNGVAYYNDSKATNVGACLAALDSFSKTHLGKVILIAGGDAKDADLSELLPACQTTVKHALLIGRDAPIFATLFAQHVSYEHCTTLEHATQCAYQLAQPGDIVLLSPATASFDMFRSFEHRGEVFEQAVKRLA